MLSNVSGVYMGWPMAYIGYMRGGELLNQPLTDQTMFKALSLGFAAATVALATTPVKAELHTSGNIGGYPIQYIDESNSRRSPDMIVINGPEGQERISVTCRSSYDQMSWDSYGPNSKGWVDYIATAWCF